MKNSIKHDSTHDPIHDSTRFWHKCLSIAASNKLEFIQNTLLEHIARALSQFVGNTESEKQEIRRIVVSLNKLKEERKMKNKEKKVETMDYLESWKCTPSQRKRLIPDSFAIYNRRASLRSAKKCSALEIKHEEEIENVGDSVAPEHCLVDEAKCIPLEQEHLAEDIQVQASDKNKSRSISMFEHPSSLFSLNLTEMVNMLNSEGDEVNSGGQSLMMDTVEVEGYQVSKDCESIVIKVLSKHGDIFKNCEISTMILRSMLLDMICNDILELQDKNLGKITEDVLHRMIALTDEIKDMKVDINWLHIRLEEILEARKILKQCSLLKEKRESNKMAIENAKREVEEREAKERALETKLKLIRDEKSAWKETLAREEDESIKINETVTYAKSKLKCFVNCSLTDGLL